MSWEAVRFPVRFFVDERNGAAAGKGAIRLTNDLRLLAASLQGGGLVEEAEARWRFVETAWHLDPPRAGLQVQAESSTDTLFVESGAKIRRTKFTKVRQPSMAISAAGVSIAAGDAPRTD